MHLSQSKARFLLSIVAILALSACLASLDSNAHWFRGWLGYSILLTACAAISFWIWRAVSGDRKIFTIALVTFLLRLGLGEALTHYLPLVGYQESLEHQSGYVFHDAFIRDRQAWELAGSNDPIHLAFTDKFSGDQYGGMLALSAAVYRYLSPDAHRPVLVLIMTASAAAWGVLTLWRASKDLFGDPISEVATWIFALYPESALLGSSQMREAFVMSAVAVTFFSLTEMLKRKRSWLVWMGAAVLVLLVFQPPVALYATITLLGVWFFTSKQGRSWKQILLLGIGVLLTVGVVISAWANLPSLQDTGPLGIFFTWLQNNFAFQSYLIERESGMFQKLLDAVGEQWKWLVVLVYGIAQPVLPAVAGDPDAAWIMRGIGFFRAAGWYLLAPFLIYAVTGALRASSQEKRNLLLWLSTILWAWIAISALNAGGDQWDNPRYRTMFLAWEATLAAWAWWWARVHRDARLRRWLIVEVIFVVMFTEWYLGRTYPAFPHFDIGIMIVVTLGLSGLILIGGWIKDRRSRGSSAEYKGR